MSKKAEIKTVYYKSFSDDFVESKHQNFKLPDDYEWIHTNKAYKTISKILYSFMKTVSTIYNRYVMNVGIIDNSILNLCNREGVFVYANHTQPVGDALMPLNAIYSKRCYIMASPANLGIPVLGKMLPIMGALPIPETISGMKKFNKAVKQRIDEKCGIIIYPEEHVWPWYTDIRPFPKTSFGFPVELSVPAFSMTTTYQKSSKRNKPKITIYIDGPFYPEKGLSKKEQKEKLQAEVFSCMKKRSLNSTFQYVKYEKGES